MKHTFHLLKNKSEELISFLSLCFYFSLFILLSQLSSLYISILSCASDKPVYPYINTHL